MCNRMVMIDLLTLPIYFSSNLLVQDNPFISTISALIIDTPSLVGRVARPDSLLISKSNFSIRFFSGLAFFFLWQSGFQVEL